MYLSRIFGQPYINASLIKVICLKFFVLLSSVYSQGYSERRSFIITQDPFEETIPEFWRMLIEHNCHCVVQLHTLLEVSPSSSIREEEFVRSILQSSPACANYYPNELDRMMKISSTSLIKLLRKETFDDKYILRQFYLTDTRDTLSKTIYHYEYLIPITTNDQYETEQCLPTNCKHSLFDFIGRIENDNRPIIVHGG